MKNGKKLISVVVPIYNEIAMVDEIVGRIRAVFSTIKNYDYEIVFFDDGSTDGTRAAIEKICVEAEDVKSVFYTRNFGYLKNTFYCMQQAKGDGVIIVHADLQNPPELIPEFIKKWENGAQIVLGVKNKSKENKFVYFLRSVFYFLMINVFGIGLTPHATEFELFDKSFIEILKRIKASTPFLRGIVNQYASSTDYVYYTQDARKKGKSKFNLNKYYDFAICGITQYSVCLPRRIIFCCVVAFLVLMTEFFFLAVPHIIRSGFIDCLNTIVLHAILALLIALIIIVCIVFEYVISIAHNSEDKPLVVEEKRIDY